MTQTAAPTSNPNTPGLTTANTDRALTLLGGGVGAEAVAAALGVSPSRISQLLSDEAFSSKVSELRYTNLQSYNARDDKYDNLEDKLLLKLESSLPLMVRPDSILKALATINGAKRRGQQSTENAAASKQIVNLVLPTKIVTTFITNSNNQVVQAGDQSLITMQSGTLLDKVKEIENERLLPDTPTPADTGS